MNYRALGSVAAAAAIAFAQPVAFIAQEAGKAAEILARGAQGDRRQETGRAEDLQRRSRRSSATSQTMQMNSDVEIVLELPDKYLRSEVSAAAAAAWS